MICSNILAEISEMCPRDKDYVSPVLERYKEALNKEIGLAFLERGITKEDFDSGKYTIKRIEDDVNKINIYYCPESFPEIPLIIVQLPTAETLNRFKTFEYTIKRPTFNA